MKLMRNRFKWADHVERTRDKKLTESRCLEWARKWSEKKARKIKIVMGGLCEEKQVWRATAMVESIGDS